MTVDKAPLIPSQRLILAFVGFLGCVVVYSLRINLSVAIVCMVDQKAIAELSTINQSNLIINSNKAQQCESLEQQVQKKDEPVGEFLWPKDTQGLLLGAFFWGYPFTQILGGWLSSRFGGRSVIGFSVLSGSILTLLSPLAARFHIYVLMALRVVLGFCQGVTFPAFHTMWSHWAPPMERSLLTGMTYAGAQIGNVVTLPITALLCKHGFAGGWPSVFYVFGIGGLFWVVLWYVTVSNSPSTHKRISEREREYIEGSLGHQMTKQGTTHRPVPWSFILTSIPVWAILIGHFAGDWGAYIMFTSLPSFMNDVLNFDLTALGFIASIPYIAYFICINLAGFIADTIRSKNWLSTLNTRRAAMVIALGSQSLFLILSGYMDCGQELLVIIFLTLGIGLSGFQYPGFVVNYLDIAPVFAGSILGIGNTISCVAGILTPILMGLMTPNGTREQWQGVFWLSAAIMMIGTVVFILGASGDVQSWAVVSDENKSEWKEMKPLEKEEDAEGQTVESTIQLV